MTLYVDCYADGMDEIDSFDDSTDVSTESEGLATSI